MFEVNEGHWDRACRLALGVLFGTVALTATGGGATVALATLLAVGAMATAALGFCPLYRILGIDTTRVPVVEHDREG